MIWIDLIKLNLENCNIFEGRSVIWSGDGIHVVGQGFDIDDVTKPAQTPGSESHYCR